MVLPWLSNYTNEDQNCLLDVLIVELCVLLGWRESKIYKIVCVSGCISYAYHRVFSADESLTYS
jgi:hypothetical protein